MKTVLTKCTAIRMHHRPSSRREASSLHRESLQNMTNLPTRAASSEAVQLKTETSSEVLNSRTISSSVEVRIMTRITADRMTVRSMVADRTMVRFMVADRTMARSMAAVRMTVHFMAAVKAEVRFTAEMTADSTAADKQIQYTLSPELFRA